jgi:hypothetical protein
MPAQAGIRPSSAIVRIQTFWIPAFAGMTGFDRVYVKYATVIANGSTKCCFRNY